MIVVVSQEAELINYTSFVGLSKDIHLITFGQVNPMKRDFQILRLMGLEHCNSTKRRLA